MACKIHFFLEIVLLLSLTFSRPFSPLKNICKSFQANDVIPELYSNFIYFPKFALHLKVWMMPRFNFGDWILHFFWYYPVLHIIWLTTAPLKYKRNFFLSSCIYTSVYIGNIMNPICSAHNKKWTQDLLPHI